MAANDEPTVEARLETLMKEVDLDASADRRGLAEKGVSSRQRLGLLSVGTAAGLALALLLGIQLGTLPWRFRREIWQAQGTIMGLVVGFTVGRLTGMRAGSSTSGRKNN